MGPGLGARHQELAATVRQLCRDHLSLLRFGGRSSCLLPLAAEEEGAECAGEGAEDDHGVRGEEQFEDLEEGVGGGERFAGDGGQGDIV
ncbi:hypothetical protein [Micromonospora sp. ATCC 39149]|uniref:hypothetical protein n=1 Tax=Micromonospora sp. (strain ATCC 39149 / NRRL 15099 / SCC 1413) TaxID=219305 RepID=UPI000680944D|nr:hypothetical protein [Micromonospora sp. ATCC 39149]